MTHIEGHFTFGRIGPPPQWYNVDPDLIAQEEPEDDPYDDKVLKRGLHILIKYIRGRTYTADEGKDVWKVSADGDCEDKCLFFLNSRKDYLIFNSLRLAICELPTGQQHAVLLLYTEEGTKVIDPTLSTIAVDWDKYPVKKWIMRHRKGFLWENFKEAK